jgi:hypothetical protein
MQQSQETYVAPAATVLGEMSELIQGGGGS